MMPSPDWPIAVRTIDVQRPLAAIDDVGAYPRTRVFVLDGGALIGGIDIRNCRRPISAARLRQGIGDQLVWQLTKRALYRQIGVAEDPPLPPQVAASIIVPTCNRPDDLRRCLAALAAQQSPRHVEIIVVDNRPGAAAVRDVVREFARVRLIEEPRRGLSYARNAGFAAASGDILIAIDDDVTVPAGWLERLVAPFLREEVMAVTGQVLPIELETEAQCRFEAYGGLGKGFSRFEVNGDWFHTRRGAVPTWHLGATANAAFRAAGFRDPSIGLLDEALGAGMPTGCSEDTYLFYRILKAGHTIVYEPTAWVWHRHRRDSTSLRAQIYAYSKGHVAYHLTTLLHDGDRRALQRLGWSLPKVYAGRAIERLRRRSEYPIGLILTEIAGNLAGPFALWRARRIVRRLGRSAACVPPAACAARETAAETPPQDAVSMEGSLAQTSAR
jgi:GT2 family glycosyltransferase